METAFHARTTSLWRSYQVPHNKTINVKSKHESLRWFYVRAHSSSLSSAPCSYIPALAPIFHSSLRASLEEWVRLWRTNSVRPTPSFPRKELMLEIDTGTGHLMLLMHLNPQSGTLSPDSVEMDRRRMAVCREARCRRSCWIIQQMDSCQIWTSLKAVFQLRLVSHFP